MGIKNRAIVGINPKNGQAEIIATVNEDNLKEVEKLGFLPVITTTKKAKEVWGDAVDPFDLIDE